jgi:hypothetical protein
MPHLALRVLLLLIAFPHVASAQGSVVDTLQAATGAAPGWIDGAPTLRRGAKGDAAALLQTLLGDALAAQGKRRPGVDSAFGPRTEAAVKTFQTGAKLAPTGVVDVATWAALAKALPAHPLGDLSPFGAKIVGPRYRRTNSPPARISPREVESQGTRLIFYESKMSIDADGAGDAWKSDPWGQPETSLRYADGRSLNPTRLHFVVLPGGFAKTVPGLRLGDVVAVVYRGQVAYGIYGDVGPKRKIGEGSIKLAETLGIDADPKTGGAAGGVLYMVFPGSGTGRPLPQAEIDRRGAQLLRAAGGKP